MIDTYQSTSDYLREKYFPNDYMGFGTESGYYTLSVNSRKYEIPVFDWNQASDFNEEPERRFILKYPELFL